MKSPSIVLITNIPTPYRNHLYSLLYSEGQKQNIDFTVWFTAHRLQNTDLFSPNYSEMNYRYTFFGHAGSRAIFRDEVRGAIPLLKHWNRERPSVIIIGGWLNVSLKIACILSRLNPNNTVLWCENHQPLNRGYLRDIGRRFFLRSFRNFIVPGILQEQYVSNFLDAGTTVRFHAMPNIVREQFFHDHVLSLRGKKESLRQSLGLSLSDRIFLSIMRLEKIKATDLLLKAFSKLNERCKLIIAGEGSLRSKLETMPAVRQQRAILLGNCSEKRVAELLALADVFVLPSRNDPYPLAAIEAVWAGLPLVLSDAVGCHPEVLEPEINGFLCDAGSLETLTSALHRAAEASNEDLHSMGTRSIAIAQDRYSSQKVVSNVISFLRSFRGE